MAKNIDPILGANVVDRNVTPADAACNNHRLIDGKAAAERAGCSYRHWLRLCDAGHAPWGVKLGALRRWDSVELENWISK